MFPRDSGWKVSGNRAPARIENSERRHMCNTASPAPNWLGNPQSIEEGSDIEPWEVPKAYRKDPLRKVREEGFFPLLITR